MDGLAGLSPPRRAEGLGEGPGWWMTITFASTVPSCFRFSASAGVSQPLHVTRP